MSSSRLVTALLLLSSCAAWDSSTPTYVSPPNESPTPSHYAPPPEDPPPPPVVTAPAETPPGTPPAPPPPATDIHAAIASVQLYQDCPEPAAPAAAGLPGAGAPSRSSESASQSQSQSESPGGRRRCEQSTVQLAVRSHVATRFRIDAIRVLDATTRRKVGKSTMREPTRWADSDGTYTPWDEQLAAGADLQISYKLGDLDLSRRGGSGFNAIHGPFMLELDVTIAGKRHKLRSEEFGRYSSDMIQT